MLKNILELTTEEIIVFLEQESVIKEWFEELKKHALNNNIIPDGWRITAKKSSTYTDKETVKELMVKNKIDLADVCDIKAPKSLIFELDKLGAEDLINEIKAKYIIEKEGEPYYVKGSRK